jgi:hypothetical protein
VQFVLVELRALVERVGRRVRDLVERVARIEAVLAEHLFHLLAELLEEVGRFVGDECAAEEERMLGCRRMDSAAKAVCHGELARVRCLVEALARDVRHASRDREQSRAALEVRCRAGSRLCERSRLPFVQTLAYGAKRKDGVSLHRRRLPDRARTAADSARRRRARHAADERRGAGDEHWLSEPIRP